jgi:hypothetical protein
MMSKLQRREVRDDLYGQKIETYQFTGDYKLVLPLSWLVICPFIPDTQDRVEEANNDLVW